MASSSLSWLLRATPRLMWAYGKFGIEFDGLA